MSPDRLDTVIKVSFATTILGVTYSQFVPESSSAVVLFVWLAGMAGVAVAGFWRARLVRNARMPPIAVSGGAVHPATPPMGQARRSETLRDLGLIAFLIGLLAKRYRFFAVLVACFAVPVGTIGAFVLWPPSFWVLLALGFGWLLVRRWGRAHPRPHA